MSMTRLEKIAHTVGLELPENDLDPYGTATNLWFAVAMVLDASDVEGDVSPKPFNRWQYQRAPYVTVPSIETIAERDDESYHEGEFTGDYDYHTVMLASAYQRGDMTQDDLIYIGDCMSLYVSLLRSAGKDY